MNEDTDNDWSGSTSAGAPSPGWVEHRDSALAHANRTPAGAPISAGVIDSVEVHFVNPSAAVLVARRVPKDTSTGGVRFLHVFAKRGNRWLLVASSTTAILTRPN